MEERLANIEQKLDALLALVERFKPLLDRIAKNPFLKMGR